MASAMIQRSSVDYDIYGTDVLRLVMVGMTGTGKSALGNSIFGAGKVWLIRAGEYVLNLIRHVFESRMDPNSVTVACLRKDGEVLGHKVAIVDTPGFFDTRHSVDETLNSLMNCIYQIAPGPHAILLVIRAGRFTDEVVRGVALMREIFGEASVNFLIIVFTHVESFLNQCEGDGSGEMEEGKDDDDDAELLARRLDAFVSSIPLGPARDLLNDCNNRYIGVSNTFRPKSPENRQQIENLLGMIDKIANDNAGRCYTQEYLQRAYQITKTQRAQEEAKKAQEEAKKEEEKETLKRLQEKNKQLEEEKKIQLEEEKKIQLEEEKKKKQLEEDQRKKDEEARKLEKEKEQLEKDVKNKAAAAAGRSCCII